MRKFWLLLSILFIWTCSSSPTKSEPAPQAPTVNNLSITTNEDTPATFTMTGTDPEGAALTFSVSTQPQNGTVTASGAAGIYTPNENFNGTDTFAYIASDGALSSTAGLVSVTVTAVDDDPNTMNVSAVTDEDNAVVITLEAEEYDGDTISFNIKDNPAYGTVSLTGDKATYTPNENYYGADSFTFEAVDTTAKKILNAATASITINPINDAPEVGEDLNLTVKRGHTIEFTLRANDVDNNNLNYNIDNIVNNITSGTIQSINDSTFRYLSDYHINQVLSYKVDDGSLESDQANIYIKVENSLVEMNGSTSIQAVAKFSDGTSISVDWGDRIEFINSQGYRGGGGAGGVYADLTQLEETKNGKIVACGSTGNDGGNLMIFNGWLDYESSQYNAMACAGTYDFGYIGATTSNDLQTINFYKLNSSLEKIWENSVQVSDGCCLNSLKMISLDNNTHVVSYMENYSRAIGYVIFNDSGEIVSQNKITRNTGNDSGNLYNYDIIETDSGFVLSYQANATNYLLNVNTDGTILSEHQFGKFSSCKYDSGGGIKRTSDGGYILVGYGESYGHAEDISCADGNQFDGYIFKLDSSFNIEWKKTFGLDTYSDGFNDVIEVSDGYLAVGWVSFQQHTQTAVFVKFDKQGNGIY